MFQTGTAISTSKYYTHTKKRLTIPACKRLQEAYKTFQKLKPADNVFASDIFTTAKTFQVEVFL